MSAAGDRFPELLDFKDVARITKRTPKAVLNAVSAGRMVPPPITNTRGDYYKPHRWHPETVQKFLDGKLSA
jgi:hypothetical protein